MPPANQDAHFIQSLEGALLQSKATASFYSGKRKADQRVEVDSSGDERIKAADREAKDPCQRRTRDAQFKGVGSVPAPSTILAETAAPVLEPPVMRDASALWLRSVSMLRRYTGLSGSLYCFDHSIASEPDFVDSNFAEVLGAFRSFDAQIADIWFFVRPTRESIENLATRTGRSPVTVLQPSGLSQRTAPPSPWTLRWVLSLTVVSALGRSVPLLEMGHLFDCAAQGGCTVQMSVHTLGSSRSSSHEPVSLPRPRPLNVHLSEASLEASLLPSAALPAADSPKQVGLDFCIYEDPVDSDTARLAWTPGLCLMSPTFAPEITGLPLLGNIWLICPIWNLVRKLPP